MNNTNLIIKKIKTTSYTIPTVTPESDGTLEWDNTTIIIVQICTDEEFGMGYTYADKATAEFIAEHFITLLTGKSSFNIKSLWYEMKKSVRNLGESSISSMAISAVDIALWDLKARVLKIPLVILIGQVKDAIAVYGSGGFTSYSIEKLQEQLSGWVKEGMQMVKMKIGREPNKDVERVKAAREAIGKKAKLFVDANGAYREKEALYFANEFRKSGVTWFEEPVVMTDKKSLSLLRENIPGGVSIAAGEYGFRTQDFFDLLKNNCVDVLQIDATRSEGITGFLHAASLAEAFHIPVSSHTAPSVHLHVDCCVKNAIHAEYFFDHVRIEEMFFDGYMYPRQGMLRPDLSKAGLGITLKEKEVEQFKN